MAVPLVVGAAAVSTLSGIGSALFNYFGQKEAAKQNRRSAEEAARHQFAVINELKQQEAQATSRTIFEQLLEARRAEAATLVSAGESGVSGISVDLLMNDIERQQLTAEVDRRREWKMRERQRHQEKLGVNAQMQQRIASMPEPSALGLGLSIAGRLGQGTANAWGRFPTVT